MDREKERETEREGEKEGSEGFLSRREGRRKIRIMESLITFRVPSPRMGHEKRRSVLTVHSRRGVNRGLSVRVEGEI